MLQQGHLVHKGQLKGGVLGPWNSRYVTAGAFSTKSSVDKMGDGALEKRVCYSRGI